MYLQYGGYQHNANEVMLTNYMVRPQHSPRGRRQTLLIQWNLTGELLPDHGIQSKEDLQSNINSKMIALENAYQTDYQDIGFFRDDGSITSHYMLNNHPSNLSGNLITHFNWFGRDREEFAGKRTYQIGVKAEFIDSAFQILNWRDSMMIMGDGGATYSWARLPTGLSVPVQRSATSTVRILHRGMNVGATGYLSPPTPTYGRPFLLGSLTRITQHTPIKIGQPGQYLGYTTQWQYIYEFPNAIQIPPVLP
jgi:hypothetical protein